MKINQLFSISFQSVLNNKLRTTLTLLGVSCWYFFHNCNYDHYYYASEQYRRWALYAE